MKRLLAILSVLLVVVFLFDSCKNSGWRQHYKQQKKINYPEKK